MKAFAILACVALLAGCAHKPKNMPTKAAVTMPPVMSCSGCVESPPISKDIITSTVIRGKISDCPSLRVPKAGDILHSDARGCPEYIQPWKRFVRARVRTIKTTIAYSCKSVDPNDPANNIMQCEPIYDTTTEVSCADKTRIQLRADDGKWWCLSPGPEPMP